MKRYYAPELYEAKDGMAVSYEDHVGALAAAVRAEREAIKAHLDSDAMMPSEWAQREPLDGYSWERGLADVIAYIDSRPSPAVDVLGVVREFVAACDEHSDAHNTGITITDAKRERIIKAFDRKAKASVALRALVSPTTGEGKDGASNA